MQILKSIRRSLRALESVVTTVLLSLCSVAHATSVLEVSLERMVLESELVFEGRVLDVSSAAIPGNSLIRTVVHFEVLDVIAGNPPGDAIALSFLGGEAQGRRLHIDGMLLPEAGEHGIYFVEFLNRPAVNPLFGWSQGHLRVMRDPAGVERITSANRQPVLALNAIATGGPEMLSTGVAHGVVADASGDVSQAMSLEECKKSLHVLIGEAR